MSRISPGNFSTNSYAPAFLQGVRFCLLLCRSLMEGWRITLLNEKEKTIFVDADACPVKDEILQTASDYEVQVLFCRFI